jgi:uncharacterized protein YjbI with pentapeptide repeats
VIGFYERWQTAAGQQLAEAVFGRLAGGQGLDGLDLPRHDGRVDLRGLVHPGRPEPAAIVMRDVSISDLDLSGCRLPHLRLFDCELRNCRFDDGSLEDLRVWRSRLSACGFSRAKLNDLAVSGPDAGRDRSVFASVDFAESTLTNASLNEADFRLCSFADADLAETRFVRCGMTDCRFSGPMNEVIFDSRPLDGQAVVPFVRVDLSAARLDMCEFFSCEFVDSAFPEDPDGVLIVPRFGEAGPAALARLAEDGSEAADDLREIIQDALSPLGASPGSTWLIAMRDLEDWPSGDELAALAEEIFGPARSAT